VRRSDADLIGLQEAQTGNLKAYHEHMPEYRWTAWPEYGNQKPHEWPAIVWHPRALTPVDSGGFWLSETPECYSRSWETDCIRAAAWVKFQVSGSDASVVHLNTHLDHISEQARIEGTRLILARLDELQSDGSAAVVTGDFNTPVDSPTYRLFTDAGFVDTHIAAGNDDNPAQSFTYHGWQGTAFRGSDEWPRRIDWVLARGGARTALRTRSCEIVRDAAPPVYPSDHYPVLAELDLAD
jgi:endonuclease/exonuclease/phosphatase family metal-dependent hydrolase